MEAVRRPRGGGLQHRALHACHADLSGGGSSRGVVAAGETPFQQPSWAAWKHARRNGQAQARRGARRKAIFAWRGKIYGPAVDGVIMLPIAAMSEALSHGFITATIDEDEVQRIRAIELTISDRLRAACCRCQPVLEGEDFETLTVIEALPDYFQKAG